MSPSLPRSPDTSLDAYRRALRTCPRLDASEERLLAQIEVVTDAAIALYGAIDGAPGLVVIAGTGSICCGINARHKRFCAGGWGPIAGDEGGGAWLARRALRAVAYAFDGRGPKTELTDLACAYFHVTSADDLTTAIYAPTITNERLAGFGRDVVNAAKARDEVALQIVADGGTFEFLPTNGQQLVLGNANNNAIAATFGTSASSPSWRSRCARATAPTPNAEFARNARRL